MNLHPAAVVFTQNDFIKPCSFFLRSFASLHVLRVLVFGTLFWSSFKFFSAPLLLCICTLHCVHPWTQLQKGCVLLRLLFFKSQSFPYSRGLYVFLPSSCRRDVH